MSFAGKLTRSLLIAGTAVLASGTFAATAAAGTVDYTSVGTFGVPNNTGQAGIPSQVFVPPGRAAVQSLELTKVMPSYGAGGGGDLQLRLKAPNGTEITLLSNSQCGVYPNTSAFTISDSAAISIDTLAFCNTQLPTGSGKPTEPLSTFNGSPTAGVWTVTVVDVGANNVANGSWNGWTLHLTHANPTLKADPAPFKVKRKFAISAVCDANCTVTTGGAAKRASVKLVAGSPGLIVTGAKKKARKKGKGTVTLTAVDETGGTATVTTKAKVGK